MRTMLCVCVIAAAAACHKAKAPPPTAGSGSAVAAIAIDAAVVAPAIDAPPPAPVCFPADFHGTLDAFAVDDVSATICGVNEAKATKCLAMSFSTGVAREAQRPAPPPAAPTGGYTVQDDDTTAAVCKNGACTKLALQPIAGGGSAARIAIAPGGTIALAPLAAGDGSDGLAMFDTATGRREKILEVRTTDYTCAEPAHFLGDVIYATASQCSQPRARAQLFKLDGSAIGSLPEDYNFEGGVPVHLDGDTWAVPTLGGADVIVFEVKSAHVLRAISKLADSFHAPVFAPGAVWPVSPLARTPSGKLVAVSLAGGISVLDPAAGKVEHAWAIPTCAPAAKP